MFLALRRAIDLSASPRRGYRRGRSGQIVSTAPAEDLASLDPARLASVG
jgi:hypothetical protein